LIDKRTVTYRTDYPFVCETGVGIDLMPLVCFGNDWLESADFLNHSYEYVKRFKNELLSSDCFEEVLPSLEECLDYCRTKNDTNSQYVGVMYGQTYGEKNIYRTEWFREGKNCTFESDVFSVPYGYHNLLSQIYGEYMVPPPISEQNAQNHPWKNYWRNV
jgi:hypothetical protein